MPKRGGFRNLTAKALAVFAIGMGLGFGACGFAAFFAAGRSYSQFMINAGAMLFFVSLFGIIVTGLIALGRGIVRLFRK